VPYSFGNEYEKQKGQLKITDALKKSAKFGPMYPKAKTINTAVVFLLRMI
jgi:hypothetical protein